MAIRAFPKIFALGVDYIADIFDGDVEVSEKADGCFEYGSQVVLADGSKMKIGEIVNQKLDVEVLSLSDDGVLEARSVVGWHKNGTTEEWLRVRMPATHGQEISLRCTPNHRVLTPLGWKEAGELVPGEDRVIRRDTATSEIQRQVLLGTLLGDSCISGATFSCGHSEKQSEYLELKFKLLESIGLRRDVRTSGYGSKMLRIYSRRTPLTKGLAALCLSPDGKKRITKEWLQQLTPLSLAFLYMDDGSCAQNETQRGYVMIATNGFPHEDVELLAGWLSECYGLTCSIRDVKGSTLVLTTESTGRFFSLIFPFIPQSMQYKMWPEYRTGDSVWSGFKFDKEKSCLTEQAVKSVEKFTPNNKTKYDISVDGNHNYLINGYVVHNSQFIVGMVDGVLHFRSKGKMMFPESYENMFDVAVEYVLANQWPDNTVYYCEYLRKPKHNTIKYDRVPKNNLMVFGVSTPGGTFVSKYADLKYMAERVGLEAAPLLYYGKVENIEQLTTMLETESYLGGSKIEGVVVKNYEKAFLLGGQPIPMMAGKLVSEAFKEVHKTTWEREHKSSGRWQAYIESFATEARWQKAVQHLEEAGELDHEPRDIGKLIAEIQRDIQEEEEGAIKEWLWGQYGKDLLRGSTKGAAEWYKKKIAGDVFPQEDATSP
jgi:hypothetical protein